MACVVKGCTDSLGKKAIMCSKHWYALPQQLRDDVRRCGEKGAIQTLRAAPSREWLVAASRHVGDVKNLVVRADANNKTNRKYQDPKPQEEPIASA